MTNFEKSRTDPVHAEVGRQRAELTRWAKANGRELSSKEVKALTTKKEKGGGEEHEVFLDGKSVIKITKPDSWAAGATPAQYFARWSDIGKLFPGLEPEVIGVSGDQPPFPRPPV